MPHPQLIVLTEFVESLEREMRFLSPLQRCDRLASLLHATARLDADDEDDVLIDRLVLRACDSALSAEHSVEAAVDMVGRHQWDAEAGIL